MRIWFIALVATLIGSGIGSAAWDKPGDGNDPLPAEICNGLMPAALLGLIILAVIAVVRARRRRSIPA